MQGCIWISVTGNHPANFKDWVELPQERINYISYKKIYFTIGNDIQLRSTLTAFYTEVPISMNFEPIVDDKGNIILKQTRMNVGLLKIPPETTMKIMRDSVEFPSWITVHPNDAEIYIDLSRINIASGSRVRAKELDLPNDKILLEIIVPGE